MIKYEYTPVSDESDRATRIEEQERQRVIEKRKHQHEKELKLIDLRYRNGGFIDVYCEDCGVEIPPERLKAAPYAVQCVECKRIEEMKDKRYV